MYRFNRNVLTSLIVLLGACTPADRNQESEVNGKSSGSPVIEIVAFMEAQAANNFVNSIDASTMVMKRYAKLN